MQLKFSDIFSGEYLQVVEKYSNRIQYILSRYEVVIFMARKAICFYDAMVKNGAVNPTNCRVLSSRVLDYNMLGKVKNKKIALIDDVVVKGDSLRKVAEILNSEGITADTYVVACQESFKTFNENYSNISLKDTYAYLNSKEIYTFSAMITEYIEATMCPFNIDQPLFWALSNIEIITNILLKVDAANVTSGLQHKYSITNKVVYFSIDKMLTSDPILDILQKSILKIRFLYSESKLLAIPFVLFPEITYEELDGVFSLIGTDASFGLVENENEKVTFENKLKLVNYLCSELLLNFFAKKYDIEFKKIEDIDIFQFSIKTDELFDISNNNFFENYLDKLTTLNVDNFIFSSSQFSTVIQKFYEEILLLKATNQDYYNAKNIRLADKNEKIITNELIAQALEELNIDNNIYLASCAVDVMIDRGMIVPAIVHRKNHRIVRGYKLGEYSKLTREQVYEFAQMLYCYQGTIKSELNRTEFEKLCVIYFASAIRKSHFEQQANYEDDCYGISYSLYGPRVTMSKVSYKVKSSSALADLFLDDDERLMIIDKNKKYVMTENAVISEENSYGMKFAYRYAFLRKLFENSSKNEDWGNKYAHTYIQYLTLEAIGVNFKNQFLSLCAELYQLTQLTKDIFNIDKTEKARQARILSGINSGLWKYQCYTNEVLNKMQKQVLKKSPEVFIMLDDNFSAGADKNPRWQVLIDLCAEELFTCAYLINAAISKFSLQNTLSIEADEEIEDQEENDLGTKNIFNQRALSCNKFNSIRERIESSINDTNKGDKEIRNYILEEIARCKKNAQLLLDLSDVVIENNNPSFKILRKILLIYSKTPLSIDIEALGIQSIEVKGIKNKDNCKCIPLPEESGIPILATILDHLYGKQGIHFIVINIPDKSLGIAQSERIAQGRELVSIINSIILELDLAPINSNSNDLIIMGKSYDKSFEYEDYTFKLNALPIKIENQTLNTYAIRRKVKSHCVENTINIEAQNVYQADTINIGGKDEDK